MSRSRQGSKHSILCQYLPFDLFSENHTKHGVLSVNYKSTLTEEYHAFLVFYGIFSFLFSRSSASCGRVRAVSKCTYYTGERALLQWCVLAALRFSVFFFPQFLRGFFTIVERL